MRRVVVVCVDGRGASLQSVLWMVNEDERLRTQGVRGERVAIEYSRETVRR